MAINIISGNLNTLGNNGNFESDPSVWGFDTPDRALTRIFNGPSHQGNFSLFSNTIGNPVVFDNGLIDQEIAIGNIPGLTVGKKYVIEVYCKANSSAAEDTNLLRLKRKQATGFVLPDFSGHRTLLQMSTSVIWEKIEARFTATAADLGQVSLVIERSSLNINTLGASVFADAFYCYEYEDVILTCVLAATIGTVNATGLAIADGSATISVSAGTPPYEYSKDNGITWQSSNVFSGLLPGAYLFKVRETVNTTCVVTFSQTVNFTNPGFDFTFVKTDETIIGAADGTIVVTPTVADTYNFSFDGGVSYQGSNLSPPLAAGTYNVIVKKMSNGALVGKLVTINVGVQFFQKVYWSKNPIPFSVQAASNWAAQDNLRMYAEVKVEDVADSGVFTSKIKTTLYPSATGLCLFNLRQAMRSIFSLAPPAFNSNTIIRLTDRMKTFVVITDTLVADELVSTPPFTTSNPFKVLYGGLSSYAHALSNFFDALPTTKKFLTWQPNNKLVEKNQEDYLNYYVFGLTTSIKLRVKAYFDDATDQTATLLTKTGVQLGHLYQIPAGPTNSGALTINAAKNVTKYEVSLLDQTDTLISEVRTYVVNANAHPLSRFLMIVNSLGAHEVHRLTGEAKKENNVSGEVIQKYLPPVYDALQGQFENSEASFQSTTEYSTGFFTDVNGAAWQAYFTDVQMTKQAFELIGANRYPLAIVRGSIIESEDRAYNKFVRFKAVSGYTDLAYTPL